MPKISLLTPCFNHEKYIINFLESVKSQTFSDFEVVIVDDCSTDNTIKIIQNFGDNRIKLIKHEYNKGLNAAINTAFENSTSPLCVYFSSDDVLKPDTLEYIVNEFENNPDKNVLYCSLSAIDEDGKDLHKSLKPKLKDRFEILRKIFYSLNPLLSPTMTFRRKVYEKIHPLSPSIVNHQDSLMHIQLLLNNEIMVVDKELAYYRMPNKNSGLSIRSITTENRENLEINELLNYFLQINNPEMLYKIFGNDIEKFGKPIKETISYFLARLALNSDNQTRKVWGYNTIVKFLNNQENFDLVNKLYGFNYKEFLGLVNVFDETEEMKLNKKVKKYKNLFNTSLLISIFIFIIMLIFIVK